MKSRWVGLLALVIAALTPSLANATTRAFDPPAGLDPTIIPNTTYHFHQDGITAAFLDDYDFSIAPVSAQPLEAGAITFAALGGIPDLTLKLFQVGNPVSLGTLTTVSIPNFITAADLQFSGLLGGNYFLEVKGTPANGVGSYSGQLTVSAVPLPAALPLMATGLLGLGLLIARRRKETA